ncbi:hemin receptor [bacterium]|nr:hemin receptor [bacterium]
MNAEQIMLVQSSWEELRPLAEKTGELLYRRVFELAPELRERFPGTEREQGEVLMKMIGTAVDMLFSPATLDAELHTVGRRHAGYGARPADYRVFHAALIWTLERLLGEAFTQDVRAAWDAAFTHFAETMQAAQQEAEE